jgi:hypothetical protein
MDNKTDMNYVQAGDLVLLVGKDRKEFIVSVASGQVHQALSPVLFPNEIS